MKRYRFPLANVLRIRKVQEDQAIAALAEAERHRASVQALAERRRSAHEQAGMPPGRRTTLDAFLAAREQHQRTAEALRASEAELEHARRAIAARRAALQAAVAARGALEQLDERRRAEHALEAQREEDIEVDDLVTGRFTRGER